MTPPVHPVEGGRGVEEFAGVSIGATHGAHLGLGDLRAGALARAVPVPSFWFFRASRTAV